MSDYWRQFPVQLDFSRPFDTGWGRIIDLDQLKTRDGLIPRITLAMDDGSRVVLVAAPKLLRNRLVDLAPARGDFLRVAYVGEADKAPQGMNPTKHFKIGVRRAEGPAASGDGQPPHGGAPVADSPPAEQAS